MGSSTERQRETGPSGHEGPRPALAWGAWITCSLIWGSTFLFISLGNDALAPVWAASLRLALAAVLLTLIARGLRHPFPRGRALRASLSYGLLQFGVNFPLLYWAEKTFPSGLTAVIFATIPLTTALTTAGLRMERLTALKLAGAGVALAGVALLFSDQLGGRVGLVPGLVIFTAATFFTCAFATVSPSHATDGSNQPAPRGFRPWG